MQDKIKQDNKFMLTLVTGSDHKLKEWQRFFPDGTGLTSHKLDLDEIQSLDSIAIVTDKVKRAYAALQRPVLVEDVSAGLDELGGLPGPFIKFFEVCLGASALYDLVRSSPAATVTCTIGYYDGTVLLFGHGEVHGTVVPQSGSNGFGFDGVFMPNGQTQTYAAMDPAEKDKISHRHLAIENLLVQLKELKKIPN